MLRLWSDSHFHSKNNTEASPIPHQGIVGPCKLPLSHLYPPEETETGLKAPRMHRGNGGDGRRGQNPVNLSGLRLQTQRDRRATQSPWLNPKSVIRSSFTRSPPADDQEGV